MAAARARSPVTSAWSPCASVSRWRVDGFASPPPPARVASSSTGSLMRERGWPMPPEQTPITVLLVEDHLLVSEGLAVMINATGDLKVVGTAATAAEAVRLAMLQQPDVVVMDSHLPDGDGADIAGRIREGRPAVPFVFLSADESDMAMIAAVRAGACAYLPKSRATADVVEAVRRAAEGEMLIPATQLARLLARAHEMSRDEADRRRLLESLTRREMEVLSLMADGLDHRAIAAAPGIGFTTVRGHVQNVLEKLDAHSKLEALACAARYGLLDAA